METWFRIHRINTEIPLQARHGEAREGRAYSSQPHARHCEPEAPFLLQLESGNTADFELLPLPPAYTEIDHHVEGHCLQNSLSRDEHQQAACDSSGCAMDATVVMQRDSHSEAIYATERIPPCTGNAPSGPSWHLQSYMPALRTSASIATYTVEQDMGAFAWQLHRQPSSTSLPAAPTEIPSRSRGRMSRAAAECYLAGAADGVFLLRESESLQDARVISVAMGGTAQHILIQPRGHCFQLSCDWQRVHLTVEDAVNYFEHHWLPRQQRAALAAEREAQADYAGSCESRMITAADCMMPALPFAEARTLAMADSSILAGLLRDSKTIDSVMPKFGSAAHPGLQCDSESRLTAASHDGATSAADDPGSESDNGSWTLVL